MFSRYVIKDLISQGYWSKEHKNFKGIIFASQYTNESLAQYDIKNEIGHGTFEIIKIYRK